MTQINPASPNLLRYKLPSDECTQLLKEVVDLNSQLHGKINDAKKIQFILTKELSNAKDANSALRNIVTILVDDAVVLRIDQADFVQKTEQLLQKGVSQINPPQTASSPTSLARNPYVIGVQIAWISLYIARWYFLPIPDPSSVATSLTLAGKLIGVLNIGTSAQPTTQIAITAVKAAALATAIV